MLVQPPYLRIDVYGLPQNYHHSRDLLMRCTIWHTPDNYCTT